jgi:phosphoglucosamine mutase
VRKLFGTDGIRGVANIYPMTTELAMQVGRGVAFVSKKEPRRHRILIGKDTRLSGYMLENSIAAGICSMGVDVMLVGPLPTPGIAFLTRSMRADAGIVISASHNAFQDNGIKVFGKDGFKLPDQTELEIEELIFGDTMDALRPTAEEVGKAFRISDAQGRYIVFLKNTFPQDMTLDGFKVAIDCAHGATYRVAPAVFEELGAEVILTGVSPNGQNINGNCGALYPEAIASLTRQSEADVGIAFDGDGDRIILIDEKGTVVDGDSICTICAQHLKARNALNHNTIVGTLMSNMGMEMALREMGIKLIRAKVGDRYVVEEMLKHGLNLGGEQSGHIIFLDFNTTGDGILSALQVLALMRRTGKRLSELAAIMKPYPQTLVNVKVREKPALSTIPAIKNAIEEAEKELKNAGRILVRYSGTENLARVMVEAEDPNKANTLARQVAEVINRHLGV